MMILDFCLDSHKKGEGLWPTACAREEMDWQKGGDTHLMIISPRCGSRDMRPGRSPASRVRLMNDRQDFRCNGMYDRGEGGGEAFVYKPRSRPCWVLSGVGFGVGIFTAKEHTLIRG